MEYYSTATEIRDDEIRSRYDLIIQKLYNEHLCKLELEDSAVTIATLVESGEHVILIETPEPEKVVYLEKLKLDGLGVIVRMNRIHFD